MVMHSKRFRVLLANGPIWLGALIWISYQIAQGFRPQSLVGFLIALAVVIFGELIEVDLRGGRTTPVSSAVIFALFVVVPPVSVTLAIVLAFGAAVIVKSRTISFESIFRSTSRRLLSTLVALCLYHFLIQLVPVLPIRHAPGGELLRNVAVMVWVGMLQLVLDTGIAAWLTARWQRIPWRPIWRALMHSRISIHVSFLSVAALMALTHTVLSEMALILFMLPILAARKAFRRFASIHKTYVQTVRALSRVPEMAGYAPTGHSARVASLARSMARDQGLSDSSVEHVEFAALMHDIGLISFDDPSEMKERPSPASLSSVSASLLEQTPYLERVGAIVRASSRPFTGLDRPTRPREDEEQMAISSGIVRVARHFADLTSPMTGLSDEQALSVLETNEDDYDPRLVTALKRVLQK